MSQLDPTDALSSPLAHAQDLLERGDGRGAVDHLAAVARGGAHPDLEAALVGIRHRAAATMRPASSDRPATGDDDLFAGEAVPEIARTHLTAEVLAGALARHGCILVRGFLAPAAADRLLGGVRGAFEAAEAYDEGTPVGETTPWYVPFEPVEGFSFGAMERGFARALGGVLTVESPRVLAQVIEAFGDAGVGELLSRYFGEWPVLSAKKSTLRRAAPDSPTEWHQDGAFLGAETRTVNAWVALTPCGSRAPGIEVFPHAFDHIVETGTDDARFSWSVSPTRAGDMDVPSPVRPDFGPGDALLFNQMTLHRTGLTPDMTDERFAIESWFFAPSTYPYAQVPILF